MSLGRRQAAQKSMWLIYDQLPQKFVRMRAVVELTALTCSEYLREIMRDFIFAHFQRTEAFDPGRIDKS